MDTILYNLARPYYFLVKEGAFPILLALLLSSIGYSYYYDTNSVDLLAVVKDFLFQFSNPFIFLLKVVSFLISFFLLHYLFTKTFLKHLNKSILNYPALLGLVYLLYLLSPTVCYAFILTGVLLLVYKYLIKGGDFGYDFSGTPFGNSRWSTTEELKDKDKGLAVKDPVKVKDSFLLGRTTDKSGTIIGFKGEGHVLTVAKTGAGKGVGVVVPNLLQYGGSVVVVDPKGENFIRSVFARTHRFKQKIYLVDPFGEVHKQVTRQLKRIQKFESEGKFLESVEDIKRFYTELLPKVQPPTPSETDAENLAQVGEYYSAFNPLQLLDQLVADENFQEIFDQASVIANMVVIRDTGDNNGHWDEKAKMIIKNAIIFTCIHEDFQAEPNNLVAVKSIILTIFESEETFQDFVSDCANSTYSEHLVNISGEFAMMADEERQSVLSFVLKHLGFIDSPLMKASVSHPGLRLADIKEELITVYLVMPANKLDAYNRLLRLWIASLVNSISLTLEPPVERILMIVDEMAQLGRMEPLIQAVSLLRGYGLNLWMIFQDLSQLQTIYGSQWKTFSSNARFQQFFGISDTDTAEYVSALSGQTTVVTRGETVSVDNNSFTGSSTSHNYQAQERKLLYPDTLYRSNLQYLFTEGLFPIQAEKLEFYKENIFRVGEHLPFALRDELKTFF